MSASAPVRTGLFIEDDFFIGWGIVEHLRSLGIVVDWARNLREAEEAYEAHGTEYIAIIFDGRVPDSEHTTVSLATRIKESGFSGQMICASGHPDQVEGLTAAGCTRTIRKPYSPEVLDDLIQAA